jgi:hypothetical protein
MYPNQGSVDHIVTEIAAHRSDEEPVIRRTNFGVLMSGLLLVIVALVLLTLLVYAWPLFIVVVIAFLGFKLYEVAFFHGSNFKSVKESVREYVNDCNELNDHIHELESTEVPGSSRRGPGLASYRDVSRWNYKRMKLKAETDATNVYNCSRAVCGNARNDPIKYVCKYFGIKAEPASVAAFEELVNNYSAAIDGKKDLEAKRKDIIDGISVPWLIKKLDMKRFERELGFEPVGLDDVVFPAYKFQYVSSGGNASMECTVEMNLDNLDAMLRYLDGRIRWSKSVAGQRALMTPALRRGILERDGYICQKCGANAIEEPHLLLEVDHIVPVSKGGLTRADNLQTLCWKCNRSKGAKLESF